MDRGAWQAAVHDVTKESDTTQQLNSSKAARQLQCSHYMRTCESTRLCRREEKESEQMNSTHAFFKQQIC